MIDEQLTTRRKSLGYLLIGTSLCLAATIAAKYMGDINERDSICFFWGVITGIGFSLVVRA